MRTSPQSRALVNGNKKMRLPETNVSIKAISSHHASKPDKEAETTTKATESTIFIGENSFSPRTRIPAPSSSSSSKSLSSPTTPRTPTFIPAMMTPPKQKFRDMLSARRTTTPKKKQRRIPGLWKHESYNAILQVEEESAHEDNDKEEEKSWEFQLAEMLEKTSLKHKNNNNDSTLKHHNNNNNDWTESNGTLETCEETEISDDSGRGQHSSSSSSLLSFSSLPSPQPNKHCKLQLPLYSSPNSQKQQQQQEDKQKQLVMPLKPMRTKFTVNMDKGGTAWVHSSCTAAPHLELNIVPVVVGEERLISGSSTRMCSTAQTPRKRRGRRSIISNQRTFLDHTP